MIVHRALLFFLAALIFSTARQWAKGLWRANRREPYRPGSDCKKSESLEVLLVTSGCCHDYDFQTKSMQLA